MKILRALIATLAFSSAAFAQTSVSTQYKDGTTSAAPFGNVMMFKGAGNAITAVTSSAPLPVTLPTTLAVTQSGTWTVQPGNTANSTPWLVSIRPSTSGGNAISRFLDLNTTDVQIKASAGQLYGYYIFNASNAVRYFKLYNATTATVVVGTTTPALTIPLPSGSAANVHFPTGIAFSTAITAACTTGIADSDTGAPGANECVANFFYN